MCNSASQPLIQLYNSRKAPSLKLSGCGHESFRVKASFCGGHLWSNRFPGFFRCCTVFRLAVEPVSWVIWFPGWWWWWWRWKGGMMRAWGNKKFASKLGTSAMPFREGMFHIMPKNWFPTCRMVEDHGSQHQDLLHGIRWLLEGMRRRRLFRSKPWNNYPSAFCIRFLCHTRQQG